MDREYVYYFISTNKADQDINYDADDYHHMLYLLKHGHNLINAMLDVLQPLLLAHILCGPWSVRSVSAICKFLAVNKFTYDKYVKKFAYASPCGIIFEDINTTFKD